MADDTRTSRGGRLAILALLLGTLSAAIPRERPGSAVPPHEVMSQAGTLAPADAEIDQNLTPTAQALAHWRQGDLQKFAQAALTATFRDTPNIDVLLLAADVHLALGELAEAESMAVSALHFALGLPGSSSQQAEQAIRLWTTARLRQQKPLADAAIDELLGTTTPGSTAPLPLAWQAWRDGLAGAAPYRAEGNPSPAEIELRAGGPARSTGRRWEGIEAAINGSRLPLVFIDTGSQHTVISREAALEAGVSIGPSGPELVGFASSHARPAVLRELKVGAATLHDVPVLVVDPPAAALGPGQAALGIDVLWHLLVTIDYPRHRVRIEPAIPLSAAAASAQPVAEPVSVPTLGSVTSTTGEVCWEIPLWTFAQAALAQARLPDGAGPRTLVDTGNRSGAFVSQRWAKKHLPEFHRPATPLLPWHRRSRFKLDEFTLGERRLVGWRIDDVLPDELERLEVIDLLLGHDLLARHSVTIDLAGRRLRLCETSGPLP